MYKINILFTIRLHNRGTDTQKRPIFLTPRSRAVRWRHNMLSERNMGLRLELKPSRTRCKYSVVCDIIKHKVGYRRSRMLLARRGWRIIMCCSGRWCVCLGAQSGWSRIACIGKYGREILWVKHEVCERANWLNRRGRSARAVSESTMSSLVCHNSV